MAPIANQITRITATARMASSTREAEDLLESLLRGHSWLFGTVHAADQTAITNRGPARPASRGRSRPGAGAAAAAVPELEPRPQPSRSWSRGRSRPGAGAAAAAVPGPQHVSRILVPAQALEPWVAQLPVPCPLGEGDLPDQLRLDPVDPRPWQVPGCEGRPVPLQLGQVRAQTAQAAVVRREGG